MPVICFGPICVPTNLLFPFVIGILHRYGYLKWFRTEWVTFKYWRRQVRWLIWSIVKSRIVKWWRGDKTPDSLERPPTEPGQNSEAQQAEQAATDATQNPQAGITSATAQQPSAGQRAGGRAAPATDSATGQTSAGQRTGNSRSGQTSGPQTPASSKPQGQAPSGWLSWLTGSRTAGSQQAPRLSAPGGKKAR